MVILSGGAAVLLGLGLVALTSLLWLYLFGAFRGETSVSLIGRPAAEPDFIYTAASLSDSLISQGTASQFWSDIDAIQRARLALMAQAQHLIQFETFKFDPGQRADAFAEVICERAQAGVMVHVLADSYGAHHLPERYWRRLTQAGVEVRFFNGFSPRSPLDYVRRNHRKLLVVDQQVAMVGGAGISDLWDGEDNRASGHCPWYDFEIEWRGDVAGMLTGFFWQHWLAWGGKVNLSRHQPSLSQVAEQSPVLVTPGEEPTMGNSPIRSLMHISMVAAQERLWIASPYLLPDDSSAAMLGRMKSRGVDVRILTMGPKSDKPYVYYTARERYGPLLGRGIAIHEYQPSMMHGKAMLIDHHWVSLGSANLDPRSFFHNDELNLCHQSPQLIQHLEAFFEQGFERSQRVNVKDWRRRPWKQRFLGRLGNLAYWQL